MYGMTTTTKKFPQSDLNQLLKYTTLPPNM